MLSQKHDHVQSVKELIRHSLYVTGGARLTKLTKRARGLPSEHISNGGIAERFSTIYEHGIWGGGSASGPGSNAEATRGLSQSLTTLLAELRPTQVTDIGCGDFGWMQHVKGDYRYTGVDIVASLIEELNRRHGSGTHSFRRLDATSEELPQGDVAICREVLFHLSFEDAGRVLQNCKRNGYVHLIATTDSRIWFNANIASGDHRPLNLERAPFYFPPPVHRIEDGKQSRGRVLGVWRLSEIKGRV